MKFYIEKYNIPKQITDQMLLEHDVKNFYELSQADASHMINWLKLWGMEIQLNDLIIKNADHEKDIKRLSDFIECILASDLKLLKYVKKSILKYNHEFITQQIFKKNDLP